MLHFLTAAITKLEVYGVPLHDLEAIIENIHIWMKIAPDTEERGVLYCDNCACFWMEGLLKIMGAKEAETPEWVECWK